MRIATLTSLFSLVVGAAFFVACSSSSSGGGNTGGAGGSVVAGGTGGGGTSAGGTGATTSGGGGAGGSGGTTTGGGSCKGQCGSDQPQGPDPGCYCDSVCEGNGDCCSDYSTECPAAPQVTLPTGCVTNTNFKTYCNPVTNEGCTGNAACDYSSDGVKCYPDGNTEQPGAQCDSQNNKFCIPTYHCDGASQSNPLGTCKKFCCSNADCGGGTCVAADAQIGTLGVCNGGSTDAGTGGTGGTDAGTDAGSSDAATD